MTRRRRRRRIRRLDLRARVLIIDGRGVSVSVGSDELDMKRMTTMNTFCYC